LPEEKASRSPYYYLPFGEGPRNCVARRLALLEMKIAAVHILQKFRFKVCEETGVMTVLWSVFWGLVCKGCLQKIWQKLTLSPCPLLSTLDITRRCP